MNDEQRQQFEQVMREYQSLAHAMQSGVAADQGLNGVEHPKHLRVGINTAMSDHGALVALLIEKGVFTELEYAIKLREFMQQEVDRYKRELSLRTGANINLS